MGTERSSPRDASGRTNGAVLTANLVEIFSSIQGEGPDVGSATLFVRFGGCDLRCCWCDSVYTWQPATECRIETARGSGQWRTLPNPLSVDAIVAEAHLLDFDAQVYGRRVELSFEHHLRAERQFPDLEALQTQIAADVKSARELLGRR